MQARHFKQPWFTLATLLIIGGLTFSFYISIKNSLQVDNIAIEIYKVYGFFVIGLASILTIWTIIKNKRFKFYFFAGLLFIMNIWIFFSGLNNIQDLPYQQRFVFKNDTSHSLTDLKVIGDTVISVGSLEPSQKVKVTYKNYLENTSIEMTCNFRQRNDTIILVAGRTNSIGYLNYVSIKAQNNKLKVDITQ